MSCGTPVAQGCFFCDKNDIFDLNIQGRCCTAAVSDRNDNCHTYPGALQYCLYWGTICKITPFRINSVSANTVGLIKSHVS